MHMIYLFCEDDKALIIQGIVVEALREAEEEVDLGPFTVHSPSSRIPAELVRKDAEVQKVKPYEKGGES